MQQGWYLEWTESSFTGHRRVNMSLYLGLDDVKKVDEARKRASEAPMTRGEDYQIVYREDATRQMNPVALDWGEAAT